MTKTLCTCIWALLGLCLLPQLALAQHNTNENSAAAVILTYQRIGEDAYPDTNIRTNQFLAHIEELKTEDYNVLPLPTVIEHLKQNKALPEKTVVITFEGAYKSALTNAIPELLNNQIPFTVFFASDHADSNIKQHMSWSDLKRLNKENFVTLGLHPAEYKRLSGLTNDKILSSINKARLRYRKRIGTEPAFFSYPFGEYSRAYRDTIENQGFKAALSLHSGSVSSQSDIFALPRFTMTENYGSLERFQLVTNAKPFPVHSIEPRDPYLKTNTPAIGFSVSENLSDQLDNLSCFVSGQDKPKIEILGQNRVELKLSEEISEGRTRVNCTLPLPHKTGEKPSWRWFGLLLINRNDENETLNPQQAELQ